MESEGSPCRRGLSGCFCVCCWGVTLWPNNVLFIFIIILFLLSRPCAKKLVTVFQSLWTVKTHPSCSILQAEQASPRAFTHTSRLHLLHRPHTAGKEILILFLYPSSFHSSFLLSSPFLLSHLSHYHFCPSPSLFSNIYTIICHLSPSPSLFITSSFLSLPPISLSSLYHPPISLSLCPLLHSRSLSISCYFLIPPFYILAIHFSVVHRAHDVLHDVAGSVVLCSMP